MYDFFFRCGKSCSHAAALAFKAEAALQTGLTKTASTSFLCQCNDMSRKKVNILQAFDYFGVFNNNASILNPYNYNTHTSLRSPNCSNYIFIWFQFHLWNLPWKPNCFHIDYFQLTISRPSHVSCLKSTSEEANMAKSWTHFLSLYQDYLTQTGKRRDRKSKLISQNLRPYNQMLLCFQVLRWKKNTSWTPMHCFRRCQPTEERDKYGEFQWSVIWLAIIRDCDKSGKGDGKTVDDCYVA